MLGRDSNAIADVQFFGCTSLLLVFLLLLLLPLLLLDVMQAALMRMHLTSAAAGTLVLAILIGGFINIPVYHKPCNDAELANWVTFYGNWGTSPYSTHLLQRTTIAVNVGGCIVPTGIALWQLAFVSAEPAALVTLAVIATTNILVCYRVARPVKNLGIVMPGLVSPLVAVALTWLLLPLDSPHRVCIAFIAGVLGPLVGADLLHLRDLSRIGVGTMSIGGAGTFDGIVMSGILAALLA